MTHPRRAQVATAPPTTEKQFLQQVRDLGRMLHWKTYHPLRSMGSDYGWPDLVQVRGERLLFTELKSDKGKLTPAQEEWLEALRAARRIEVYLRRPADLDEIVRTLR